MENSINTHILQFSSINLIPCDSNVRINNNVILILQIIKYYNLFYNISKMSIYHQPEKFLTLKKFCVLAL